MPGFSSSWLQITHVCGVSFPLFVCLLSAGGLGIWTAQSLWECSVEKWHRSVLSFYNLLKVQFLRTKKTLCFRKKGLLLLLGTISRPRGSSFRWTHNQVDWQLNCIYRIPSSLLSPWCWEGQTPLYSHFSNFITHISYRLLNSVNSQSQLGILVPQLLWLDIYQRSTKLRARRKWGNLFISHQRCLQAWGILWRIRRPAALLPCHVGPHLPIGEWVPAAH